MRRCPACLSSSTREAFRASGSTFIRCTECRSLFDEAPRSRDELATIYDGPGYFTKDADDPCALNGYQDDYLADRPFIEAKFDRVLAHLERYVSPGRLLDLGCGPGFLVSVARRRGWEAQGLDVNPWASEYARDELSVEVGVGELYEGRFEPGSFDAVTAMDMIEHVPDAEEVLRVISQIVRPGGAIALLTPDAGAVLSRVLGRRWPEVQMPGEHPVLFSRRGLSTACARHGLVASGWHSVGKQAPVSTILADVTSAAPVMAARARQVVARHAIGERVVEVDPRTKFVLYARRAPAGVEVGDARPGRVPKRPERLAGVDEAILVELENLGEAKRYCDWLYDAFSAHVAGARILEVGAGVGTFSQRMLDDGAESVLLLEPEPECAEVLRGRFDADLRVEINSDPLPDAERLADSSDEFDLVVCQNVLEHIDDDRRAVEDMARVLRPGGLLSLIVPAGPWLFGPLDDAYGHWRRYDRAGLRRIVESSGLVIEDLRPLNALGVPAWWLSSRRAGARVSGNAMKAYEPVVAAWRPIEDRLRPPVGLSLVCTAVKPAA